MNSAVILKSRPGALSSSGLSLSADNRGTYTPSRPALPTRAQPDTAPSMYPGPGSAARMQTPGFKPLLDSNFPPLTHQTSHLPPLPPFPGLPIIRKVNSFSSASSAGPASGTPLHQAAQQVVKAHLVLSNTAAKTFCEWDHCVDKTSLAGQQGTSTGVHKWGNPPF